MQKLVEANLTIQSVSHIFVSFQLKTSRTDSNLLLVYIWLNLKVGGIMCGKFANEVIPVKPAS